MPAMTLQGIPYSRPWAAPTNPLSPVARMKSGKTRHLKNRPRIASGLHERTTPFPLPEPKRPY